MAVISLDLKEYNSVTVDDTDVNGGIVDATSEIISEADNNLFPDITSTEALVGATKYRKSFWKNTNASFTLYSPIIWAATLPTRGTWYMGVGLNHADDTQGALSSFTQFAGNAVVSLISDGVDVRSVDIIGENTSGVRTTETVVLTGAVEVLSVNTYSKIYAVSVQTVDASRTVTIKEGSGGTTRGTIAPSGKLCTTFMVATSIQTKVLGIKYGNMAPSGVSGLWHKMVIAPFTISLGANALSSTIEGDTL